MKLQTKASILANALRKLAPVVKRDKDAPVLGCVQFRGKTLTATNLDVELIISVPAESASGSACIDHRTLNKLVSNIQGDETVTVEGGSDDVRVSFANGRYELPSLPVGDFPELNTGKLKRVDADGSILRQSMKFCSPFMSIEETRYYLNGICLDGSVMVATDGHRLAASPAGGDFSPFGRPIVPAKAASLLCRNLPEPDHLLMNERYMVASGPGVRLTAKLIDGTYPDWRRVVHEPSSDHWFSVDPRAMRRAMKRIAAVAPPPRGALTIAFGPAGAVALSPTGKDCEFIPVLAAAGSAAVGVNAQYLADVMGAFAGVERVTIFLNRQHSTGPMMIRGEPADPFIILMPMRTSALEDAEKALAGWTDGEMGRAA